MKRIVSKENSTNIQGDNNVVTINTGLNEVGLPDFIKKITALQKKYRHDFNKNGILQFYPTKEVSVYSRFNDPLYEFYTRVLDYEDEAVDYTIKNYSSIKDRYYNFFSFIVSQEISDFYSALATAKSSRRIFCFDTSLEDEDLSIWNLDSPYGDLTLHTWELLDNYSSTPNQVERFFIIKNPQSLVKDKLKLKKIFYIAKKQLLYGISPYFISRYELPESIGDIKITDEILNFHIIESTLIDIMDIETFLSYRFNYDNEEGIRIINSFMDLFNFSRGCAESQKQALKMDLKITIKDFSLELSKWNQPPS